MDPLIEGFEDALHEANRATEADRLAIEKLVAALQRVIEASRHRAHRPVTVSLTPAGRIELRRAGDTCVLERYAGRWRLVGQPSPAFSGPVASAITAWLTSKRSD